MRLRFLYCLGIVALAGCGSNGEPIDGPTPGGCLQDPAPGHKQVECGELTFELNVPEQCMNKACGLIFDVHGFAMNGELENQHTEMRALGGEHGYIVVQPNAPGQVAVNASWSESHDSTVFDFLQQVKDVWHVDADRVHFGGYSQGAMMTWRFICKHSDVIASAAPMAGGGCGFSGENVPEHQIEIFYTHGTTDGFVPFETGVQQRDALLDEWNMEETQVVSSGSSHEWTRYENGQGTVFEFAQHDWETDFSFGGAALEGHCFPGTDALLGCGADTAFNWGEAVVEFYMTHPRDH